MKSFFEWFHAEAANADGPWLILGKGPSFARCAEYDFGRFRTLGLNHVVRERPVTVAHMIDYDVVDQCGDVIERNARVLVMPWIPHEKNRPAKRTLEELVHTNRTLRRMADEGRLLWYNLSTAPWSRPGSPVVAVRFFSAEAALRLLTLAGIRRVRSLGIDGGATYSRQFMDLRGLTLLSNGRSSFDRQFGEIARILLETGVDYAPLDAPSPVRIYVGATEAQEIPVRVLEYSIRKHASLTVEVLPLHKAPLSIPTPKRTENRPRTPFSLQRFLIPELTGFSGRAIYLDSDMQVFRDIRALWTMPFDGADVLAVRDPRAGRPQFAVMVLDCDKLQWDVRAIVGKLDSGELGYETLVHQMGVARNVRARIDPSWNRLDRYRAAGTALLHYTDMERQPWVCRQHAYGHLWLRDLFEAIGCGFLSAEELREHVARGHLRPSILHQLDHRLEEGYLLPPEACESDAGYLTPSGVAPRHGASFWRTAGPVCIAAARNYYRASPVSSIVQKLKARFE